MIGSYSDHPCVCGHAESQHPRVVGGCRGKDCKCPSFVNEAYVEFLRGCVRSSIEEFRDARARLRRVSR